MRSTVLPICLLTLTLGLPGALAAPQETVVITSSGPTFPWGMLGVLGLMGLAYRPPARRRTGTPVQLPSDSLPPAHSPAEHSLGTAAAGSEMQQEWPAASWEADESEMNQPEEVQANWPEAGEETWDERGGEVQPTTAYTSSRPQVERPSERLNRRPPGAPDLSKPPGRH